MIKVGATLVIPLPDGWMGTTLSNSQYFKLVGSGVEYWKGLKNYVSTKSIQGTRIVEIEAQIQYASRPFRANMQPKAGRVAFAKMKDTLKVLLLDKGIENNFILSTGFSLIEPRINSAYLFYYFQSWTFNHYKDLYSEGSTQQAISNDDYRNITIRFPQSLAEQQKIAEILSTVDKAIAETEQLIEKYKRIKQGLTQDLFRYGIDDYGHIRSDAIYHFQDTLVGKFPEGWAIVNFGDYITLLTDYHANGSYEALRKKVELLYESDYAIMIRTMNLENNNYKDLIYVNRKAYEFLRKSIVKPRDILMNKIANAGSVYLMPDLKNNVTLGMNLFLIRTNEKELNQEFVFNYLKYNQGYVKSFAKGTTTKTITKNAVRNLLIVKPRLDEQSRISSILLQAEKVITKEKANKQKLLALKHGLIADLLTGKVRVNHLIN